MAHDLKSVAGPVGASEVQRAAEALEAACVAGAANEIIDELLAAAARVLDPVIAGLQMLQANNHK
jgi:HPt (histidine-containing phosphotransfer) domain-containing protein